MKFLLLTLALLTLTVSAEETELQSTTAVARGAEKAHKWWMPRHRAKLKEKQKLGDVQLVFIGDSITHAWEKKGKKVWAKNYAKYNALNLGYSGDRTEHVLWRIENGELDGITPKAIVLMIGTNNVGHRKEESAKTAAGIKAILDLLAVKQPKAKVLLLAIFPRGADNKDPLRKLNDATNQMIASYADGERVQFLSINDKFVEGDDESLSREVMPDRLHPNAAQYKVWADAIAPALEPMLK